MAREREQWPDLPLEVSLKWASEALGVVRRPLVEHVRDRGSSRLGSAWKDELEKELRQNVDVRDWHSVDFDDVHRVLQVLARDRRIANEKVRGAARQLLDGRNAAAHPEEKRLGPAKVDDLMDAGQQLASLVGAATARERLDALRESFRWFRAFPLTLTAPSSGTLFVIPCSSKKRIDGGHKGRRGPSLLGAGQLSTGVADRLAMGRRQFAGRGRVNEKLLWPAHERYDLGSLWQGGGARLREALSQQLHLLILTGGYGVVRWDEPIGHYDLDLEKAEWKGGLLPEVLLDYSARHGVRQVVCFASSTSPRYGGIMRATPWRKAGVERATVLEARTMTGGPAESDRALGEALADLLERDEIRAGWISSTGAVLRRDEIA